jgi:hypothetical protein
MRITDYPDLLRTKGKEPMPQAWDETNQDWTPAIDSAATLKALREALGAPADATQADPVQEATAIALLKGLLELTAMRATDQTLTQIKTALTDGTQKVALTGKKVEFATLADAISVPAGGSTGYLQLYPTSEDLILVAVNIDQYPWTLGHSTMYYGAATGVNAMYPMRKNVNETFTFTAAPAISMWLGNAVAGGVTSYSDAIAVHRVYKSVHGLDRIAVFNKSASTATVTVRIIRVWTK